MNSEIVGADSECELQFVMSPWIGMAKERGRVQGNESFWLPDPGGKISHFNLSLVSKNPRIQLPERSIVTIEHRHLHRSFQSTARSAFLHNP